MPGLILKHIVIATCVPFKENDKRVLPPQELSLSILPMVVDNTNVVLRYIVSVPLKGDNDLSFPFIRACNTSTEGHPFAVQTCISKLSIPPERVHPSFVPLTQFCSFWEMRPEAGMWLPNGYVETSIQNIFFRPLGRGCKAHENEGGKRASIGIQKLYNMDIIL